MYQWSCAGQLLEQSRRPEDGAGELARHHAQIRRPRALGLVVLVQEEEREDFVLIESLRFGYLGTSKVSALVHLLIKSLYRGLLRNCCRKRSERVF